MFGDSLTVGKSQPGMRLCTAAEIAPPGGNSSTLSGCSHISVAPNALAPAPRRLLGRRGEGQKSLYHAIAGIDRRELFAQAYIPLAVIPAVSTSPGVYRERIERYVNSSGVEAERTVTSRIRA